MKKKLIIFLASGLLLAIACSIWLTNSSKDVIQRNTYINDTEVSLMSVEEAKKLLDENLGYGTVSIVKDDIIIAAINKEDYSPMAYSEASLEEIRSVNHSLSKNFTSLFVKSSYDLKPESSFTLDSSINTLRTLIEELKLSGDIESQNAYVFYDETIQKFVIVEEEIGNIVDMDKLIKDINSSGGYEQDVTLNLNDYFLKPAIVSTNDELCKKLELFNSNVGFTITYSIGNKVKSVDANTYLKWAQRDENGDFIMNEDNLFIYDEEALKSHVTSLVKEYNTIGQPRNFNTSTGKVITINNGSYGYKVNVNKELEQFFIDFNNKKDVVREPIWEQTAYSSVYDKNNDIGNTYVEVSKEDQHVWVYIDGELKVDTDCVTGCVATKHDTSTGVWRIYIMQTDKYLIGPTWKSWVSYWMRFTSDGQGLHDATWRSSFGGNIYKTNGSHGCVNLPKSKAAEIYKLVEIGVPVVVY